jgi:phage-related protein
MPIIGARCHEPRIKDVAGEWRIIYRIDPDAILIVDVFLKKSSQTPPQVVERCRRRLLEYDAE